MTKTVQERLVNQWEKRAKQARKRLTQLEAQAARERSELEITRPLLEKAVSAATREAWEIQVEVAEMILDEAEEEIAIRQSELALCEAMLTEIRADRASEEE